MRRLDLEEAVSLAAGLACELIRLKSEFGVEDEAEVILYSDGRICLNLEGGKRRVWGYCEEENALIAIHTHPSDEGEDPARPSELDLRHCFAEWCGIATEDGRLVLWRREDGRRALRVYRRFRELFDAGSVEEAYSLLDGFVVVELNSIQAGGEWGSERSQAGIGGSTR